MGVWQGMAIDSLKLHPGPEMALQSLQGWPIRKASGMQSSSTHLDTPRHMPKSPMIPRLGEHCKLDILSSPITKSAHTPHPCTHQSPPVLAPIAQIPSPKNRLDKSPLGSKTPGRRCDAPNQTWLIQARMTWGIQGGNKTSAGCPLCKSHPIKAILGVAIHRA
jgi:hypothetical protein